MNIFSFRFECSISTYTSSNGTSKPCLCSLSTIPCLVFCVSFVTSLKGNPRYKKRNHEF